MSIANYPDADFTPTRGEYTTLTPFRYWCQKILPLAYDDSLSYYELLCKVVDYLNKTMEDTETLNTDVENLHSAYVSLQTYVNTYFDSLDVQEEINSKLDEMASDGTLNAIIEPYLPNIISTWLSEHITPTTPAIDASLSVRGAGADAKMTGAIRTNAVNVDRILGNVLKDNNVILPYFELGGLSNGNDVTTYTAIRTRNFLPNNTLITVRKNVRLLTCYYNANKEFVAQSQVIQLTAGQTRQLYNGNATYIRCMVGNPSSSVDLNTIEEISDYVDFEYYNFTSTYFKYNGEITSGAFSNYTNIGFYNFTLASLANITDKPSGLSGGGILLVYNPSATGQIFQQIVDLTGKTWCRYGTNTFVSDMESNSNFRYRGRITSGALADYYSSGWYNFGLADVSNITDLPSEVTTGGILINLYPYAGAGNLQMLMTLTQTGSKIYTRYGEYPFANIINSAWQITWYALGDSITQGFIAENGEITGTTSENYVYFVSQKNSYNVVNYGVGGSGYVHNGTVLDHLNAKDKVDTIDFSGCQLVTLAYGINDWHYNENIGTINSTSGDGTMCGNMKYCIEKILSDNPMCNIIVLTPMNCSAYGGDFNSNWAIGTSLSVSGTLKNVHDKIVEICEYYGIEYIDQTYKSPVNRYNINDVLGDGIHPKRDFYKTIGRWLSSKINLK